LDESEMAEFLREQCISDEIKSSLSNEENFRTVSFAKRGRQHNVELLEPLYTLCARRINPAKVADLSKLLPFVPPIFHPFYLAIKPDLKDNTEIETHPDSDDSDGE
jgi:hypothetical protein